MRPNFQNHIGIFGGSFDPPHLGHIAAAQDLIQEIGFSKIWIMPSWGTPLKTNALSFEHRYAMTSLAFENQNEISVSDLEKKQGFQFSHQLLQYLSFQTPRFAMIIGSDQFENLHHWANYPHFLNLCDWLVFIRKPMKTPPEAAIERYRSSGWLHSTSDELTFSIRDGKKERNLTFCTTQAPPISSTLIRQRLSLGKIDEVKELIPTSVFNYIESNKIYGI